MHGQSTRPLPSDDGSDIAAEIGGDGFPRVKYIVTELLTWTAEPRVDLVLESEDCTAGAAREATDWHAAGLFPARDGTDITA
jgi:hypothetical protein